LPAVFLDSLLFPPFSCQRFEVLLRLPSYAFFQVAHPQKPCVSDTPLFTSSGSLSELFNCSFGGLASSSAPSGFFSLRYMPLHFLYRSQFPVFASVYLILVIHWSRPQPPSVPLHWIFLAGSRPADVKVGRTSNRAFLSQTASNPPKKTF